MAWTHYALCLCWALRMRLVETERVVGDELLAVTVAMVQLVFCYSADREHKGG